MIIIERMMSMMLETGVTPVDLNSKISNGFYNRMMKGDRVTKKEMNALAQILGCDPDYLLYHDVLMPNTNKAI